LKRSVLDSTGILEANKVALLIRIELHVLEEGDVQLLAELLESPLAVAIVKYDLLVEGAILVFIPFLGIEVVSIVSEFREATPDEVCWLVADVDRGLGYLAWCFDWIFCVLL